MAVDSLRGEIDQFYQPGQAVIEHIYTLIDGRQNQIFARLDQPLIIRGSQINALASALGTVSNELRVLRQAIKALGNDISEYNQFIRTAKLSLKLDVFVVGVLVPTAFYIFALLHAIGALGFRFAHSAPYVVDRILGH